MSDKIYSMTGFGRAEVQNSDRKITVELKSVNHRYLEFNIRAPRKFNVFEAKIRAVLKEYIRRGKIDVLISYEDFSAADLSLKYNKSLAEQYVKYARQIETDFELPFDLKTSDVLRCPDVITEEDTDIDQDSIWADLEKALRDAGEKFSASRNIEGENLRKDLLGKLARMEENVDKIIVREPEIIAEYRRRLEEKTKELLEDSQIDESRIAAEVVIFADKICTDEETVRLKSHIANMRDTLDKGIDIGRKLDFLAQEMNRESNTILSKSNDIITSDIGVELKTLIEKIREQVQNIE